MSGHLFFIMWVSGSGKGTVRKNLEKQDIKNLEFLKSYVTRVMRPGEISGDQYYFITEEEFLSSVDMWDFLEYEWVHKAWYYGTKMQEIEDGLEAGKIMMKEVDTKGLKQIHEKHPNFKKNYTSFFLDIPDETLRKRFFDRNPGWSEADFHNRLESTIFERKQAREYCDYIIDATQSPEGVLKEVLEIIKNNS